FNAKINPLVKARMVVLNGIKDGIKAQASGALKWLSQSFETKAYGRMLVFREEVIRSPLVGFM
ncbi:hypothetical protein ABN226_18500, partial [Morganella morganii]|uniref:hypothetical protein n=1 Tax=Morganella morganii TaxID=582 RepID=UPI0032DBBFCB